MKTRTKKLRKVREQNSRAFRQKGLAGLSLASEILGFPDALGRVCTEIGSSSIIDPSAHIAKLKIAMGLHSTHEDTHWVHRGDTDASLYVGFQPGLKPRQIHPQLWLRRLVLAIPHISEETLRFVDTLLGELLRITTIAALTSYQEHAPVVVRNRIHSPLLPLKAHVLH